MKKLFISMLACAATLMMTTNANAQKIAYINLDSLISIMPESKGANDKVQEYMKQLESQVMAMQTELQTKYQQYQQEQATYTDIIRATKERELNDLNQRIQEFQQTAQQDFQRKNAELSKPVYEKAKKVIDQVAKENGYKYVLDSSTGLLLTMDPADDIFALVKKKMNITAAPAPAPAPKAEQKK